MINNDPSGIRVRTDNFYLEIAASDEDRQEFDLSIEVFGTLLTPLTLSRHELGDVIYKLEEIL